MRGKMVEVVFSEEVGECREPDSQCLHNSIEIEVCSKLLPMFYNGKMGRTTREMGTKSGPRTKKNSDEL